MSLCPLAAPLTCQRRGQSQQQVPLPQVEGVDSGLGTVGQSLQGVVVTQIATVKECSSQGC